MAMVGAIFIIIFASTALTNFMVTAEVPKKLVAWTQAHVESKIVFLLAINVMLLVVGTVMDIFSAIVVVLPLIAPIAKAYGIDPYHLGVIFLLNLEVGYLHPPVGLNLFITSVKFQRPITEVMWATMPFLGTMIVALLVVTYVPSLTVVPEAERTGRCNNLVVMIHTAAEEGRAVKEVKIVDAAGIELKDQNGQADRQEARRLRRDHRRVEEGRLPVAVLRRVGLQGRRGRHDLREQEDRGVDGLEPQRRRPRSEQGDHRRRPR